MGVGTTFEYVSGEKARDPPGPQNIGQNHLIKPPLLANAPHLPQKWTQKCTNLVQNRQAKCTKFVHFLKLNA
jgi:hypothetical protein